MATGVVGTDPAPGKLIWDFVMFVVPFSFLKAEFVVISLLNSKKYPLLYLKFGLIIVYSFS